MTAGLLLALVSLGLVAATPGQADAYHYRWYGGYRYPYYWSNNYYNPYGAYNAYRGWGNYGAYTGVSPYYSWYRTYPWGWYW
jgi:hypothetical protein